MTLFVHLYISQSVELDIRSSLTRQVTSLSENIISSDVVISIDETRIDRKYSDMYIVILGGDGNIIWGSVPDGVRINKKRAFAPEKITTGKVSYYYIDRDIKSISDKGFVRAYVSENDIMKNYVTVRFICLGGIVFLSAVLTMVMLHALRRFRHSVKTMEESVDKIGT